MTRLQHTLIVTGLLLLLFAIRAHQPALQDAYIDEGFHLKRALFIYDFEQNPARVAHGKLLLYFWLGLFDTGNIQTMLPTGRLAMAIFAVISGAGVYQVARTIANRRAGLIALCVYALMPLSVFYERMALADPIASGLMTLVVWRSYIFARRPSYSQGVLLGVLIALATLAKLTMGLAVFFPLLAAVIYSNKKQGWLAFIKTYLPPLIMSGVIFCLMWSPFVVPAFLARNSDAPFILVNARNIERTENDPNSISEYVERLMPALGNFFMNADTVRQFGIAGNPVSLPDGIQFHGLWLMLGLWLIALPFNLRHHLYIGSWFIAVTLLLVSISSFVSARYFMPIAAPLAVMMGMLLSPDIAVTKSQTLQIYARIFAVLRWVIGAILILWIVVWALPFISTTLTEPEVLPFNESNWLEYQSGILTAGEAVSATAAFVNDIETDEPLYATWNLCHRLMFLLERTITCIPQHDAPGHLVREVQVLEDGASLLFITSNYPPFYDEWSFVSSTEIAVNDHEYISRPIQVIRIQYQLE